MPLNDERVVEANLRIITEMAADIRVMLDRLHAESMKLHYVLGDTDVLGKINSCIGIIGTRNDKITDSVCQATR